MKMLNWLRGNPKRGVLPPAPPPLSLITVEVQSASGMLPVVGEPYYQPALRDLLSHHPARQVLVAVECELDNAHDPNAVVVKDFNHNRMLGYLPRNVAADLGKRLALTGQPIICPAEIHGGEGDTALVSLSVDGAVLRERLADRPKPSAASSRAVELPREDAGR
jgi:hypothetical protein